ncbi:FliH/SctL family protein [Limnobacter sp.]|uniref:FliH/SctL family protein n=1 Tax=Limnobacter sp. TaxID=2003368 RepID=UPI003510DC23
MSNSRVMRGLDEALPWKNLAPDSQSPMGDLLAHRDMIRRREEEILKKAQALRQREAEVDQQVKASRESAWEEGHREGYNAGLMQANEEAQRLAEVCVRLQEELNLVQHQLADKVMRLVVTACRQVVQDHTLQCPQSVTQLLKQAIASISADVVYITVAASPATVAVFNKHLSALGPLSTQVQQSVAVTFKSDDRLADGGFMVFHTAGQMDYSIEMRWKQVMSTFTDGSEDLHYNASRTSS